MKNINGKENNNNKNKETIIINLYSGLSLSNKVDYFKLQVYSHALINISIIHLNNNNNNRNWLIYSLLKICRQFWLKFYQ